MNNFFKRNSQFLLQQRKFHFLFSVIYFKYIVGYFAREEIKDLLFMFDIDIRFN